VTAMLRPSRKQVTQRLSGATYSLTIPTARQKLPWILAGLAVLLAVAVVSYVVFLAPAPSLQAHAELGRLQQEVVHLQEQIKLGELRLQQEIVTREELTHQMETQSQKLRQAEQDLQFFRGQKDKVARDKTP
jgi:Tfp pilus assembly protein PilN